MSNTTDDTNSKNGINNSRNLNSQALNTQLASFQKEREEILRRFQIILYGMEEFVDGIGTTLHLNLEHINPNSLNHINTQTNAHYDKMTSIVTEQINHIVT